jgi:hypothetical protein
MTSVNKRATVPFDELTACYASFNEFDVTSANVTVTNNLCQGSTNIGFAITFVQCSQLSAYPYNNNTVGSTTIGFLTNVVSGNCMAATGFLAYSNQIGQLCNPPSMLEIFLTNMILADNQRGATLRVGGDNDVKTAYFNNSYITALSRPGCPQCYGPSKTICSGIQGMRMMSLGGNG